MTQLLGRLTVRRVRVAVVATDALLTEAGNALTTESGAALSKE
jgi:hypothetical protein